MCTIDHRFGLCYARDAFDTVNNLNGVCYDINACLLDQTWINWFDLYAACCGFFFTSLSRISNDDTKVINRFSQTARNQQRNTAKLLCIATTLESFYSRGSVLDLLSEQNIPDSSWRNFVGNKFGKNSIKF